VILLLGAAVLAALIQLEGPPVAFVYVESNVGGSSGGHTAFLVGDRVYHHQQTGDRQLASMREEWHAFRFLYAELKNRPIHVAFLDVEASVARRISRQFAQRHLAFCADQEQLGRRAADVEWCEAIALGRPMPPVPGAGLIRRERSRGPNQALSRAVQERLGPDFLQCRLDQLSKLLDGDGPAISQPLEYREKLAEWHAVRALAEGYSTSPELVINLGPLLLDRQEGEVLQVFRDQIRATVCSLLMSVRTDRGRPLLAALARHDLLDRSLEGGELLVLDVHPDVAEVVVFSKEEDRRDQAALSVRARQAVSLTREQVLSSALTEAQYNRLEEAASRVREVERGARGEPVRVVRGRMVPSRAAPVTRSVNLSIHDEEVEEARVRWHEHGRRVYERYEYDLLRRNCVTEVVETLESCFANDAERAQALGGTLDGGRGFAFIPHVLHSRVLQRLSIASEETLPSRRLRLLGELRAAGSGLLVDLRETTVHTAALYTPRMQDGAFLFFTDDSSGLRPLLGTCNLGYGLLQTLIGVAQAPFDGADRLCHGLSGMLFSLPELAFCNVRKGSYSYRSLAESREQ
jgi:hypothetical protein